MAPAAIASLARSPLSSSYHSILSKLNPLTRIVVDDLSSKRKYLSSIRGRMASSVSSSSDFEIHQAAASTDMLTAPYGTWKSPVTADIVSGASKRLGGIAIDGDGRLIWLESRPYESG